MAEHRDHGRGGEGHLGSHARGAPRYPVARYLGHAEQVIHDYFRVDLDVVWDVVANDLPKLRSQIEALLAKA
jgi:uncharacterized protein with HEPN domain